ncbi:MAG: flavodoxin-dependent (E)-4-hydroxy-3-methylbut-2-enyl-diphosphate synthase [Spirochaetes bacterium]|nr:flavodoxin-dependent (E)-4-hydroxy-3-methylbut-2-enyl-diphosphate synthase [Spirochaetota bacterium]HNV43616.1 flavodoxin-dependent (E)-4-hydroxy-3-methylbut-2-enyl-diphosphate synthase [Exilispira sp.]MBP8991272.1 flavodoxin-dependent (E)-4-hydroxy-3-methylbut-2-enyl-diphosphate synthase [Spirochaetota bacterium]HOV46027.1 flavodoxin-dependent (E)-4-hydroxy-3-methylbut-2-enyl-diphosphate synthase [Exilispira sp.]HPB47272.1 flavodoxin-dependent (E)-4-hydroxy-3-methylbut-2-enyl-diphosphate sy
MKIKPVEISSEIVYDNDFIYLQSMCSYQYHKIQSLEEQIKNLAATNCYLIRLSARNKEELEIANKLRKKYEREDFVFVADTHFDASITALAIESGFKKVRINPGNMDKKMLESLAKSAKDRQCTVRIGINGGSCREKLGNNFSIQDIVNLFKEYIEPFEKINHEKIVLSAKFSDYNLCARVNESLSDCFFYPIHLGVTEAGGLIRSTVHHTIFLQKMCKKKIGSTLRVSMTGDPLTEIEIGNQILKAIGKYKGIEVISCPTCGRTWGDLTFYLNDFLERIKDIEYSILKRNKMPQKPIKIAIMGCEVNGPGEASDADAGISLTKNGAIFFENGNIIDKIKKEQISDFLCNYLKSHLSY